MRRMLSSPDLSIRQLSQETGISAWSLYDWRKQAIKKGKVTVAGGKHSGKRSAGQKLAVVVETAAMNEASLPSTAAAKVFIPKRSMC